MALRKIWSVTKSTTLSQCLHSHVKTLCYCGIDGSEYDGVSRCPSREWYKADVVKNSRIPQQTIHE